MTSQSTTASHPAHVRIAFNPMMLDSVTGDLRPQTARGSGGGHSGRDQQPGVAERCSRSPRPWPMGRSIRLCRAPSAVINLFGNVDSPLIDPALQVTSTTTDGNQLRDALLGGVFAPVGDAIFAGGSAFGRLLHRRWRVHWHLVRYRADHR